MFKKSKKFITGLISASLCVAMVCLTGCSKEEKDLVKALNTVKIDSQSAWKVTANLEVSSNESYGLQSFASTQKANITAYTTLNKDDVLSGIKTDLTVNATTISQSGGSTSTETTNGNVYLRENNGVMDIYTGMNGKYYKESQNINQIASSGTTGSSLTPEMQAKIDELAKYLQDNSFMTKALIDAGGTSEMKKGVQTITIDYVAYIQKLLSDASTVIQSVDVNTTLRDLYANETLKNVINNHFVSVSADVVYNKIVEAMGSQSAQITAVLPAPTSGQSVYSYLGTVLDVEVQGVKLGDMPVGAQIATAKLQILSVLNAVSIMFNDAVAKVSVSIKKGELVRSSCEFAFQMANSDPISGTVIGESIKFSMNMEKDASYNFVDVSALEIVPMPEVVPPMAY